MRRWNVYKKIGILICACLISLCACSGTGTKKELPSPDDLFSAIQEVVALPEMVDLSDDYLESALGLLPEDCDGAVYYLFADGIAPDEIVIIRARDDSSAKDIQKKLEDRLRYKEQAATRYLTEYLPVIQSGVVRRDGLTLSLIVSEQAEQIIQVYEQYK